MGLLFERSSGKLSCSWNGLELDCDTGNLHFIWQHRHSATVNIVNLPVASSSASIARNSTVAADVFQIVHFNSVASSLCATVIVSL